MPRSAKKSKRDWYTYAFLTREGQVHPAHKLRNFTRWHGQLSTLLADLSHGMKIEDVHLGAYVIAVWPGQLDGWTAMRSNVRPLYYVHQGGRLEKLS